MRRFLVWLFTAILAVLPSSAQLFKYLDTQDGLSNRRVISIEKDKKGYMWFLTHEGVDKYNGKQYKHYKLSDGEQIILPSPNLSTLQIDRDGQVWALGKDGRIFFYQPDQDVFQLKFNFTDSILSKRRLPLTITRIDREDRLWLCTKNAQYIYAIPTGEFFQLESPIQEEITSLIQADDNHYYIGTTHNIFHATLNGRKLVVENDSILNHFHIIHHLYYHQPTQNLLIGTLMDGFYLYNPASKNLEKLGNMNDVNINAVIPYRKSEEEVLIATDGNGVYKLNLKSKHLDPFISVNHHYSNKMNGNIIKDIYEDEDKRLWMAVFPQSITVYSDKYPSYELVKHSRDNPNSLINNQITYIMEDSDGDIWFATSNGVCCYYTKEKRWKSLLSSYQQEKDEQNYVFISLCEASPGVILVGGYMSGMYRIDKKDMIPHYFSPQAEGYAQIRPDKYIRSIYRDLEGFIWAGGYYNLKRIHPDTYEMEHYSMEYPVTYITSKNRDELWIGTTGGLYTFNKTQKKLLQDNLLAEISNINTIYQENEQKTYIGTSGSGLYVYNNQTEELDNYQIANAALLSNSIYCILPGNHPNELFISTENELVCFNIKEKLFLNWTKEQGLFSTKFNTASGIRRQNGGYIFGSGNGAIIIQDSINLPRNFQSKMVFTDFNIDYQQMLPGIEGSPLTQEIDLTKEITLSHNQNIFSLNVSSINYDCPQRILYSWKLEGFYNDWSRPSTHGVIRYTNIGPGEYNLRVRAILLDDGHTLEERSLRITITPPLSRTVWAYIIYTLVVVFIIYAVIRYLWMRKDSHVSKEKIQFFISTAHDIRTPLTLIKAPLSDIHRNEELSEQGKANLEMAIRSTDKLSSLATKLIDFQKEELYTSDVNVTLCDIPVYLTNCMEAYQSYAEKKNINLIFEGTDNQLEAWIDRNKVDSIVHNLLSNALKYTPDGGTVKISIHYNRIHWFLHISDTGIGISSEDQKKMFKHLFRGNNAVNMKITGTGIGMLQTYKLVKRHLGKITVSSKENEGTVFHLRFPIDNKRYKHQNSGMEVHGIVSPNSLPPHTQPTTTKQRMTVPNVCPQVLIVEDNTELRNFLCQSLSEHYHIQEATNGQEALDIIKLKHPDLILSDIMMPVMRGDDLCHVLKSNIETSHIPVILLTALGDRESIIHGLETKADNYIVKPFDIEILKANIDSVLANKELIRQRFSILDYRTEDMQEKVPGIDLDQEFLIRATEIVKKHLDNEFNVDSLCAKLHMSRSSLYNKIKALTGHSPSDFVRQIRMNEAATLLKSNQYTVAEISDKLGFGDPKYFTDIFKKHYGVTPSAYMKKEKK